MEKRLASVSVIVERGVADVGKVNELIHQFGDCVVGRLGLPYPQRGVNIITLILDTTVEQLSAFCGKLGKLPGIQVKSLMAKVSRTTGTATPRPEEELADEDAG